MEKIYVLMIEGTVEPPGYKLLSAVRSKDQAEKWVSQHKNGSYKELKLFAYVSNPEKNVCTQCGNDSFFWHCQEDFGSASCLRCKSMYWFNAK